MRVVVYTATRDRLEYTKHCFETLREKAGYDYDHYVTDNGSEDGTVEWLEDNESEFAGVVYNPTNEGLRGSFTFLQELLDPSEYDLAISFDNDCEVVSPDIIAKFVDIFEQPGNENWLLSPRVEGIVNQPDRQAKVTVNGHRVGLAAHTGCIFMVRTFRHFHTPMPPEISVGYGLDAALCKVHTRAGGRIGYVEDLVVNHYETTEGQKARYPEYWQRKMLENGWV